MLYLTIMFTVNKFENLSTGRLTECMSVPDKDAARKTHLIAFCFATVTRPVTQFGTEALGCEHANALNFHSTL